MQDGLVQILGLREYHDKKTNTYRKKHAFFESKWRAPSVADLFKDLDKYMAPVPKDELWNLYYTAAHCFEEPGRKLKVQNIIPFDIDDIDVERIDDTVDAVIKILQVPKDKVGIVFTGNGIQVIVGTIHPITDDGFFDKFREHYKAICERIDLEIASRLMPGHADPSVFSKARLLRLPKTLNKKPDKPEREAKLLNGFIEKLDFKLEKISELPILKKEDFVAKVVLDRNPPADTNVVLTDCEFLKRSKADPATLPEPEWYAMLSILARLDDGRKLGHDYSRGHPKYNAGETDLKITQSMTNSGPRTCKYINTLWGKCSSCKHFNTTLVSPIMIRGPNFIKTKSTGFHEMKEDAQGRPKPGRPNYEDLRRFFETQTPYVAIDSNSLVYQFTGTHWKEYSDGQVRAFAQQNFSPPADNRMRAEFVGLVRSTNIRSKEWFNESIERRINFKNGVLNIDTMELEKHSPDFGFRYVLPYDFDPQATAPKFEQFLLDVTKGRLDLVQVILEFAGYAFSNDNCWAQKALLLVGEGANGKSTLLDVFKRLAGGDNYSSLTMSDLKNDANRYQLDGKLFNLAEETATAALIDSSLFKNLVTGGETMVKMLYRQPFRIDNRAKLMFACNELPQSKDTTSALLRRMIIVPFDATFTEEKRDPDILKKLCGELPGIFNLIIEGYKALTNNKKFSVSEVVDFHLRDYQEGNDPIVIFKEERIEVLEYEMADSDFGFVSYYQLYEAYRQFVIARGDEPVNQVTFVKRFIKLFPDYEKRSGRRQNNGDRERGLKGIKIIGTLFS